MTGDRRPDLATVRAGQISSSDTHYWIGFQLSSGPRQTLGITAPTGGLQITARDVNGDDFLDVIVTTAWTNQPVAVFLNDGHGNFTQSSPSAFPSAFRTSETGWTCTWFEIKDGTAVILSRNLCGDCDEDSSINTPPYAIGRPVAWAALNPRFFVVVSSLGRAPPSFVFHS
jgi:FG-GAP-like repeat